MTTQTLKRFKISFCLTFQMASNTRIENAVNKLVQIFPSFDESRIRDVLDYYWNSGSDVQKTLRRSIAWLQISNQLDSTPVSRVDSAGVLLNPEISANAVTPWHALVDKVTRQFPTVSTVMIETVLQELWIKVEDYDQILVMALKDPRLTGNPLSRYYGLGDSGQVKTTQIKSPFQAVKLTTGRVVIQPKQM